MSVAGIGRRAVRLMRRGQQCGTEAPPSLSELPYAPSWLDQFMGWVDRLPGPSWLAYLLFAALLLSTYVFFKWREGVLTGSIPPILFITAGTWVYYLALIHHLDGAAGRALASFRPALDLGGAPHEQLRYRLTTLPARPTLIMTLCGLLYGASAVWIIARRMILPGAPLFVSLTAGWLEAINGVFGGLMLILFCYHTIHQLRLINYIYTHHTKIDFLNISPLYAFSRFTARIAIGWLGIAYLWLVADPASVGDTITLGTGSAIALLGLAAFIWPLLGIHHRLERAKAVAKDALIPRLQTGLDELYKRIDGGQFDQIGPPLQAINALRQEMERLEKMPTWPWQPSTLRGVVTAVVLPVALGLATRLINKLIGF